MGTHSWKDPHMVRAFKSLGHALFITAGVFLIVAVCVHLAGALYVSWLEHKTQTAFESGIAKEFAYLTLNGDTLAEDPALQTMLAAKDAAALLQFIQTKSASNGIASIVVVDSRGVVVSRTKKLGIQGDNMFLTIPEGRAVARGVPVQNIAQAILDPTQMRMTTGGPVMQDGVMIGGLFTSFSMDDAYAKKFENAYLPAGVQVAFYTKGSGVYGDSFGAQNDTLINSYFNTGSDWIQNGKSDKTISFEDGSYYLVTNIVSPGLEGASWGALLFIPRRDVTMPSAVLVAFLTLLAFVFLALRIHLHTRGIERGWRYYALVLGAALPILALAYLLVHAQNTSFLKLAKVPYPLYNSTLRFQPESGIYGAGFDQSISIVADTGDEPINAVQVGLHFDPALVQLKEIQPATSTCSYMLENTIDNKNGTALISCVILSPNQSRQALSIASVVVSPKRTGTFTLSFNPEQTQVLADDGLGTNVLRMSQSSSYKVDTFDAHLSDLGATSTAGRTFVVFSPTHPNQSRWYNVPTAWFVWIGKPGSVYAYELDTSPDTIPSKVHTTQNTDITLPLPGDGIYYFHLGLVSGGPVAHYRVQIDKTPPVIDTIKQSSTQVTAGDVVRFSFQANDIGSGIQQNYYIDLGDHLFLPIGSALSVPFLDAGDQQVTLRVYDNAGNYSEKSEIVHVENK